MKKKAAVIALAFALGFALSALTLWGALASSVQKAASAIHCVNLTGTGCDASLTGGCFASIQQAINAAGNGDQIRIAAGTYTSPGGRVATIKGKALSMEGGYNSACSQHNPESYHTILDGQGLSTVISLTETGGSVGLSWLTIQNGDGHGSCWGDGCGGGIYVLDSGLELGNSILLHNTGSGPVPGSYGGRGGGIFINNYNQPDLLVHIFSSQVISNTCSNPPGTNGAHIGGGVAAYYSDILLDDNLFKDNLCTNSETSGDGGGVGIEMAYAVSVHNNQFLNNQAGRAAGGIYVNASSLDLAHNFFENNQATNSGSAAWINGTKGNVSANRFTSNTGTDALRLQSCDGITLTNNLLADNPNGGVELTGVGTPTDALLVNNTLANNANFDFSAFFEANAVLENNILAGSSIGIYYDNTFSGTLTANHNLFWNSVEIITLTNNLQAEPLLTPDYHLGSGSPAINAGLTIPWLTVDLDGNPRPVGSGYDMGAFEANFSGFRLFLPAILRSMAIR